MRKLLYLLLLPSSLCAQTVQPAPVWYAANVGVATGTVQLVSGSAQSPFGSKLTIPALFDSTALPVTSFDFLFPSQSSQTIVSGIQVVFTMTGSGLQKWTASFIYPITLTVPAGNAVAVHYDSPAAGGTVTASAVPPPTSPDGTKTPPSQQLLDAAGAVWTVAAKCPGADGPVSQVSILRNGSVIFCSIDFATIKAGVVYVSDFGSGPGWQVWNGSSFVPSAAP